MLYDVIYDDIRCYIFKYLMLYVICDVICYKIKHLHDRCLRLTYCDKNSSYEELLEKDGSVSIHHRNLAILQYEIKNELAPMITTNVFTPIPENHYIFRNYNGFRLLFARTVYHGTESILYLGSEIQDIVPPELKKCPIP